jgi:hypothetical protein
MKHFIPIGGRGQKETDSNGFDGVLNLNGKNYQGFYLDCEGFEYVGEIWCEDKDFKGKEKNIIEGFLGIAKCCYDYGVVSLKILEGTDSITDITGTFNYGDSSAHEERSDEFTRQISAVLDKFPLEICFLYLINQSAMKEKGNTIILKDGMYSSS